MEKVYASVESRSLAVSTLDYFVVHFSCHENPKPVYHYPIGKKRMQPVAELGTSGSLDGQQRLVVKGRFMPKFFEGILRRYVNEYVICNGCKSPDTILSKENCLFFLRCEKKARYLPFFHVLNEKVVVFLLATYLHLWPMMFKCLPTLSDSIINEEESKAILRPVDIS
ncbi:hypothetical protein RHMOL_Rhmol01G0363000 [Rhododendron molle]|uniref:Uncharacterized protein n=1 Tax=Rhododendron molle TaxID=49168 RepID=A0ACC0QCI9_RHOML|nr:hypothetical protein RHMOL_Rhmol01G0363000 [Rhododendron molle]